MNKASGGDGIPVDLFQILKEDAVKVFAGVQLQEPGGQPEGVSGVGGQ